MDSLQKKGGQEHKTTTKKGDSVLFILTDNCSFKRWKAVITIAALILAIYSTLAGAEDNKINYRLKWLINASVVGDIYAEKYGFFEEQGLKVKVKAGGPERDAIRELELGYAHFGVASADQVIRATEKGASIVVIAQLFQANPLQWIYREDEVKIKSLQDLRGKVVGVTYGGNDETIMKAMLAKGGISESDISLSSVRYDYTPFLRKKVDIWPVYRNTQGIFLSNKLGEEGEKAGFFNPSEQGIRFVANSVVTTEKMVERNPEIVRKFVMALLAGWEAAFLPENREKSIRAIRDHDKDSSTIMIEQQIESSASLIKPTPEFAIGTIDTKAWAQTEKIMIDQKLIQAPVNISDKLHQM